MELLNIVGAQQQGLVMGQCRPLGLKRRDLFGQSGDAGSGIGVVLRCLLQQTGRIFGKGNDLSQSLNGGFDFRPLAHIPADAADAIKPAQLRGFDFDFLLDRLVGVVGGFEGAFQ